MIQKQRKLHHFAPTSGSLPTTSRRRLILSANSANQRGQAKPDMDSAGHFEKTENKTIN